MSGSSAPSIRNPAAPRAREERERATETVGWVVFGYMLWWVGVFAVLLVLVLASDEDGRGIVAALMVFVAGVFGAGAWWTFRKLRPAVPIGIRVTPEPEIVRRGGIVAVRLGGVREDLDVGLVCEEEREVQDTLIGVSDDVGDLDVTRLVEVPVFEAWVPVRAGIRSYEIALPVDGPFSYEGQRVSFRWRVAARSRSGRGRQAREEFWVLP